MNKASSETPAMTGFGVEAQVAAATGDVPKLDPVAFVNGNGNTLSMLEDFASGANAPVASFQQERAIETTMQAFLGIACSLSGIPGKKSVHCALEQTGNVVVVVERLSASHRSEVLQRIRRGGI